MSKINTDHEKIQELLTRGVENIYPTKDYLKKLLESKKQIKVYLGIDPTGDTLHLGHAIILKKLQEFQNLGHKIILLIGNFTATIGDPTDKSATRKPITRQQVLDNCDNYKKQAKTFLNFRGRNKAEIKYNGKWFDKLNFGEILNLSSHFTVQQLLERDMFQKRIKEGKPISLHEFMYPLMQAYDSVAMEVDGEIGGNDQTFNMLAGRSLMKTMLHKEKFVLTLKLLTDNTGFKMGKTTGNMVSLNQSAKEMFGGIMSWTDGMIASGFELCTYTPIEEIKKIKKEMRNGANPRDYKFRLAKEITTIYHGEESAIQAGEEFNKVFSKKGIPEDIKEYNINTGNINPVDLLLKLKLLPSRNKAKRLIIGGGFKINEKKILSWKDNINLQSGDIVQAGKRKFAKIK